MTESSGKTAGKGRPTPKRSEAENRRGPVVTPPTNRREAARALRDKQADDRKRVREGTKRGDEKLMIARDRGPVRAFVRDFADSRRAPGVLLVPVSILVFVAVFVQVPAFEGAVLGIWVVSLLAVAFDTVVSTVRLSALLKVRFPAESKLRGHLFYGALRSITLRRFRQPPPRVSRGSSR